jgi:MFS family permease
LTVPAAKLLGRRVMFGIYFLLSAAAIFGTFGLDLPPETRLALYFWIGLTVFGVFGSFTYYLPELFPTRLRASGAGFCYNAGRILAALGPFAVGIIAARGAERTEPTS